MNTTRRPILERIWAKVEYPSDDKLINSRCWIFTGALSHKRRGQRRPVIHRGAFTGDRAIVNVARVVCEAYHGPPPTPQHEAGHTCPDGENARCINPRHLAW